MGRVLRHKDPTFPVAGSTSPGSARAGCAQVSLTWGWGGGGRETWLKLKIAWDAKPGVVDAKRRKTSYRLLAHAHLSIQRDAWKFEHRRNVYFSLKFLNLFIITTLPLGCVCVVFMQVCMCVQVLVHVFVHASACVRVWDTEVSSNVIPQESSTLVFKTRVLTRTRSLLSKLGWLASEPQGSTCLSPQHWDHTCMSPRFDERPCLKQ